MDNARTEANRDEFIWYCDSGTNINLCGRKDWFTDYTEYQKPKKLQVVSNVTADCPSEGIVAVMAFIAKSWVEIELKNTLHLPGGANLFSHAAVLRKGYCAESTSEGTFFTIKMVKRASVQSWRKMQLMKFRQIEKQRKSFVVRGKRWHERLGHLNFDYLNKSINSNVVTIGHQGKLEKEYKCDVCVKAKSTLKPYKTQTERNYTVGELGRKI